MGAQGSAAGLGCVELGGVLGDRLDRQLAELARPQLLILDELGYLPIDQDGGRLLLEVIAHAYETQSLIITTNLDLSALRLPPDSGH